MRILPWITDGAFDFLDNFISRQRRRLRVLEFGSGSSTLYFLERGCYVRSLEHSRTWYEKIERTAESLGHSTQLDLVFHDRPYNNAIGTGTYDIIFIDGRDRVQCLKSSLSSLSKGGVVCIDNTERKGRTRAMMPLLKDFNLLHFEQQSLRINGETRTFRDRAGETRNLRWVTTCGFRNEDTPLTSLGIPLLKD
jgi:predicted O-methyltransferase YrrM